MFKPGDRVRVNHPKNRFHGQFGTVVETSMFEGYVCDVRMDVDGLPWLMNVAFLEKADSTEGGEKA
jgi:ribosomal protein L21E